VGNRRPLIGGKGNSLGAWLRWLRQGGAAPARARPAWTAGLAGFSIYGAEPARCGAALYTETAAAFQQVVTRRSIPWTSLYRISLKT
jgi:hypothetical protein